MKILVVSPHRDDAAFSLTLSIDAWLRLGHSITIMNCFTRSIYAPFSDASSVHPNDQLTFVSALRGREDEAWRKQRQSSNLHVHDLTLKDAPVRLRCALEDLFILPVSPNDKALPAIRKAVNAVAHDALVLPLALGGHVDHRAAQEALLDRDSGQALAFYEDLPYAAWPENTSQIEIHASALAQRTGARLTPVLGGHIEAEAAVARKYRAALCYDSQLEDATAELLAGFCRNYDGAERLWVNSAWLDSASSPTPLVISGAIQS